MLEASGGRAAEGEAEAEVVSAEVDKPGASIVTELPDVGDDEVGVGTTTKTGVE